MIYEGTLSGKYVDLRSATVEDAEFALALRQDPKLTQYIPKLDITIEQQRAWIEKQQKTEGDYFFIIFDKKGNRIGTNSLYNIKDNSAETGRIVNIGNSFQIIESQVLIQDFAFNNLKLTKTYCTVYLENSSAKKFSILFGNQLEPEYLNDDGKEICNGVNTPERYFKQRKILEKMLYRN